MSFAEIELSDTPERQSSEGAPIPLMEERARILKRVVDRGVVRISTSVLAREELIPTTLRHDEVAVERVRIDKEVDDVPEVRQEGDTMIIPVLEERVVITRRLVLVEELRVHRRTATQVLDIPVDVHATQVSVERKSSPDGERT